MLSRVQHDMLIKYSHLCIAMLPLILLIKTEEYCLINMHEYFIETLIQLISGNVEELN